MTIHGIKGASYGICADNIGNRASIIELAAKEGDFNAVSEANPDFISAVRHLLSILEPLLEPPDRGAGKAVRSTPDPMLLGNIKAAAKNFDTMVMEQTMTELERYNYKNGADLVAWLREQTDNLNYEAIGERLGLGT